MNSQLQGSRGSAGKKHLGSPEKFLTGVDVTMTSAVFLSSVIAKAGAVRCSLTSG